MAQYPIPTTGYATYNGDIFQPPGTGQGLTIDEGKKYFVTYPTSQPGTQTFSNVDVVGILTSDSTSEFKGDITANTNIILDGTYGTNYIQFPDGSQQFSASVGDGSAFLNAGTSTTPQTFTGYNRFNQQTKFGGNNTTTGTDGIVKVINSDTTYTGTFYQDAAGGNDLTLWSSNSFGGLTVRTPASSFTVNPGTINAIANTANFINPVNCTYDISTQGVLKVYDGTTYSNFSNIDQVGGNLTISNAGIGGIIFNQAGATYNPILTIANAGAVLQNALYIRSPSNQLLSSSISQGNDLLINNECQNISNTVFQFKNPITGLPVQPFIISSQTINSYVPFYSPTLNVVDGGNSSTIDQVATNLSITNNSTGSINFNLASSAFTPVLSVQPSNIVSNVGFTTPSITYYNTTVQAQTFLQDNNVIMSVYSGTYQFVNGSSNVLAINASNQTLGASPTNNNVPTQIATTGYINQVVTNALVQTDFSITGAILSNTGGVDNSVSFQGSQPPYEYTTLTAYGVNQLYGSDISFKLSANPFVWIAFKINVKPFPNFPTGILSGLVMTDSTNAIYNMQYSFQATSNPTLSPYNINVYFNSNVYPSLANVNDGRTFTFNLQSIPGFK